MVDEIALPVVKVARPSIEVSLSIVKVKPLIVDEVTFPLLTEGFHVYVSLNEIRI